MEESSSPSRKVIVSDPLPDTMQAAREPHWSELPLGNTKPLFPPPGEWAPRTRAAGTVLAERLRSATGTVMEPAPGGSTPWRVVALVMVAIAGCVLLLSNIATSGL